MQDIHTLGCGGIGGGGRGRIVTASGVDRRLQPQNHQNHLVLKCPRCDSQNTKFCYYNNYNLSQPRHYCKNCRRYWTKGGILRNVPVGGGCRKSKRSSKINKFSKIEINSDNNKNDASEKNSHSSQNNNSQSNENYYSDSNSTAITTTIVAIKSNTVGGGGGEDGLIDICCEDEANWNKAQWMDHDDDQAFNFLPQFQVLDFSNLENK